MYKGGDGGRGMKAWERMKRDINNKEKEKEEEDKNKKKGEMLVRGMSHPQFFYYTTMALQ